jgi:hypothetical protein
MRDIKSLLIGMENTYEDIYYIHQNLVKKFKEYDKLNAEQVSFDDNYRNLIATIDNNANAMSGIYKNAHIQKQIDVLRKIIMAIPADVRAQYVNPGMLVMLGD